MAKYCCDCSNLKISDKKNGIDGYCKCSKVKKYVLGNSLQCDKFNEAYSRKRFDREKIYNSAKDIKPLDSTITQDFSILIILCLIALICKIFGIL